MIDIIAKVLGIVLTILQIVKQLTDNPTRNGEREAPQSRGFIQRYYSISLSEYEKIFKWVVSGISSGITRVPNL